MKRITTAICTIGLCLAPASVVFADQHEEEGGNVGRVYIVTVKDGHGDQFEEGVKAYFKCYGENGGKKSYNVWWAESGKLGRYAFTTEGHKWAAFDEWEEASQKCNDVFQEQFLAHVDKSTSEFTSYMEEQSHVKEGDYGVAWVINFDVGDGMRFVNAISKITEAAKEADWGNFAWYGVEAGGRHSGDFFVVILGEKFADFDEEMDPLWKMVEGVHGKEAADGLRKDLSETIDDDWSDIWRKNPEMSFSPEASE